MAEKRFRTRRHWHNTLVVLFVAPIFLLVGIFVGVATGSLVLLAVLAASIVIMVVAGLWRDRTVRCSYQLINDTLVFIRDTDKLVLSKEDILDASLIDRAGARNYVRLRAAAKITEGMSKRAAEAAYVRFCTVDIGLRSFSFGLGRGMIDRMPNARQDLVLLRMRNGSDLLLSPEYNQDMVDHIVRLLQRRDAATE